MTNQKTFLEVIIFPFTFGKDFSFFYLQKEATLGISNVQRERATFASCFGGGRDSVSKKRRRDFGLCSLKSVVRSILALGSGEHIG